MNLSALEQYNRTNLGSGATVLNGTRAYYVRCGALCQEKPPLALWPASEDNHNGSDHAISAAQDA